MSAQTCIKQFATRHNLRVSTDKGDGTSFINGRYGHLHEHDDERLAVIFLSDGVGKANSRRKACAAVGMEITQDGDTEFAAAFNPENEKQVSLAIKVAGVKTRRVLSEAQKAHLENLKAHRFSGKNGTLAA